MIDVNKVANLARLMLTEEEKKAYQPQLNEVFKYFEEISLLDTSGVEPLATPSEIEIVFRDDVVEQNSTVEDALANAPDRSGNLFKVPPVV